MRKVEYPHNSDDQVKEYLEKALALVDELEVHDELREPVFVKAVDLFASKQVILEQVVPGGVDLSGAIRH